MPHWKTVAITGVGLIGGSIGLALRSRGLADRVVGIGRREESLRIAAQVGATTETTLDLAQGVREADLIVVCTPVASIAEHVRTAAAACPRTALITDAGSTKETIVEQLKDRLPRQARFVGSHPMAGSEKQGPADADPDLFVGRTVVITPTRRNPAADVDELEAFWSSLGARVVRMSPAAHDRAVAATSHLPHLVAAALADAVPLAGMPLTAGGFRDTTRIAGGDPELWTQILLDNRENVLRALQPFEKIVATFRQALEGGERSTLKKSLTKAKLKRDALGS